MAFFSLGGCCGMKEQPNLQQRPTLRLPSRVIQLALAFDFVLVCMLMQYFLSSSAQLDQAEQLVWSQELRLGYGKQPPLYTWLVAALFQFTGASLGALLAFKFVLLFGFLCLVMHMGRLLAFDTKQTSIALLGYALLPTFVWYSMRDLTHTVLALVLSALVLRQAVLLLGLGSRTLAPQKHSYSQYVLLGVMSKYNVVVFATGLLLVVVFVRPFRQRVSLFGLAIAVVVSLLVASPHIWWFVQNSGEAVETVYRHAKPDQVGRVGWHTILSGKTWGSMLAFAMPFAPCVGLLMYRKRGQNRGQTTNARLQEAMATLQQNDVEDATNTNRIQQVQEQHRFLLRYF